MTTVGISVISTGELFRLESCLRSIAAQDFDGTIQVTVVCNGAPDDSSAIRRMCPDARVIFNSTRKGFAENHNEAVASMECDFALLLNPDVMLTPTCTRQLVAAMRAHDRAGMIGPLLRYPDGSVQPSARMFPRVLGTIIRRTPLRSLMRSRVRASKHYLPEPTADRAVDWLLGACLFVRAAAWRRVGGFDPEFRPLYVEDIDLAWRMWESDWEVWQAPAAGAVHEHQAATDKVFFDRRTLWHARAMARFVAKHPRILVDATRPVPPAVEPTELPAFAAVQRETP
jgi:GT2 family glycosyltransferase